MKRFIGLLLAIGGGAAAVWGVVHVLTGASSRQFAITNDLSVSALTGGLLGVATFTVGLVWSRD